LRIAEAVSRPSSPSWVIALVSAGFGIVGTLIAQTLLGWFSERKQTRRIRTVVYNDLEALWYRTQRIVTIEARAAMARLGDEAAPGLRSRLSSVQPFLGETQINASLGLFYELDEASHILHAYRLLHELLSADTIPEMDLCICSFHDHLLWMSDPCGTKKLSDRYWGQRFREALKRAPEYVDPERLELLLQLGRVNTENAPTE
jgi:hypothetical protein